MCKLTRRQQQVLDFIEKRQQSDGTTPSIREIARHFGFQSPSPAAQHVEALRKKGLLLSEPGQARSLRIVSPLQSLRKRVVDLPIYGSVPAGFGQNREQEANGCVSIDIQSLGLKPSPVAFALEVKGDSMIGKLIAPGDMVVIEPRAEPKTGDVVVALIDGESTLKTYMVYRGKPYLRAENPRYPNLFPAHELVIQGVMVALIRKRK
jgi:repressor LexA